MNDNTSSDDSARRARPRRRSFGSRYGQPALSPERAERQGLITHLAYKLLGGREEAMSFLNTYHASLDARPIDLAIDSAAGYSAVENTIRANGSRGGVRI